MAAMLAVRQPERGRHMLGAMTRTGLSVHALGPLRIERDGAELRRLGGAKAGARQAAAVFAFLLDRAHQGASKHEILDLIWPDVDVIRADVAFHRTVLGLRQSLALGAREPSILFERDRYRVAPGVVVWTDVAEFEWLIERPATGPGQRMRDLTAAIELYRGDYLDDCPYYGDSTMVELNRSLLRDTAADALAELGELHHVRGEIAAARRCLRRSAAIAQREESYPPLDVPPTFALLR